MDYQRYQAYHRKRFQYLLQLVKQVKPEKRNRVLDIGPGPLTHMLREHYREVWSLGFESSAIFPGAKSESGRHIVFDLSTNEPRQEHSMEESGDGPGNLAEGKERQPGAQNGWPNLPACDAIVFGEVIEHVHANPVIILAFLASGLAKNGILICQTPNSVALHKRLAMLLGRPSFNRWKSGHVTEFTRRELALLGREAGLNPVFHEYRNYFGFDGSWKRRMAQRICDGIGVLVPSFRRGQTMIFQRTTVGSETGLTF
ncbi:MAG: class I SAM-dependent methyltransferase [Planctomycetota bacterium]|nr:MAG: class I SAM-dependent methyltransferase [Planctomycetota bacterium]